MIKIVTPNPKTGEHVKGSKDHIKRNDDHEAAETTQNQTVINGIE